MWNEGMIWFCCFARRRAGDRCGGGTGQKIAARLALARYRYRAPSDVFFGEFEGASRPFVRFCRAIAGWGRRRPAHSISFRKVG
jgi:hypothetical protein